MQPTLFAVVVLVAGFFARGPRVLHAQMALCVFGAAAAISLPALGGATIGPATMFLPFLLWRAWGEARRNEHPLVVSRAAFCLILLTLWAVVSALVLPRLLAGQLQVVAIDRTSETGAALIDVRPVSGNITQTTYAVGSTLAFLAMQALITTSARLAAFRDAVLLLAGLDAAGALINLAEFHLGLPSVLELVRTGGYRMFDDYEVGGLMRLHGTFSEASAFAFFTLPLFAFCLSLWLDRERPRAAGLLALALLAFLVLSTSATAYAGLSIYLAWLGVSWLWRLFARGSIPRLQPLLLVLIGGLAAVTIAIALDLPAIGHVTRFLDLTVLSKASSASGIERNLWNRQSWSNFVDTFGVGVGVGTARASSYPFVLLSNAGVVGTLLFLAFLFTLFRERAAAGASSPPAVRAARQAVVAFLICASLVSTGFDLGVTFYAFAAAAGVAGVREAVAPVAASSPAAPATATPAPVSPDAVRTA